MLNSNNHIIATFNWNTFLDEREKANELQSRLSAWSGINMHKEINEVFNKLCPADQTWRIDQLELDLGMIDLDDLEADLGRRLRLRLAEKLNDLIIYADKAGQGNIEITNQYDAPIDKLRSYLLNGVMPWNYKASDGSFNQMLSWQFQHNRQVVISLLKEVGVTHEDVRKRMAWQMNEPNMQKTIKGFEPGNHEQVTRFSHELIKLQTKENVVRAGTADFKKNVWLWILNYLLTERGTLFNKLAFLKSSIVQMAGHYNIGYEELLQLLNEAVDSVSKSTTVKADFLLALKSLSKEDAIVQVKRRFHDLPGIKMDDKTAKLLLEVTNTESFIEVQACVFQILNDAAFAQLARFARPRVPGLLLEAITKHHAKGEAAIVQYLLEKLLFLTPTPQLPQFSLFVEELLAAGRIPVTTTVTTHIKNLALAYAAAVKQPAYKTSARLLKYLLPGGQGLMQQLMKEYALLLQPALKNWTKQQITTELRTIFWRTVLDYACHKGNADAFKKSFAAALIIQLPIRSLHSRGFQSKAAHHAQEPAYFLSASGEQLSFTKVFLLIEQCLQSGATSIAENGNTFTLAEMISGCLQHFAAASEQVHTLKVLFEIVQSLLPGQPSRALMQSFWKQAAAIIQSNRYSGQEMKALVQEAFHFIMHKSNAEAPAMLAAMQQRGLFLNQQLHRLVREALPAFDLPQIEVLLARPPEKLLLVYRKGLMAALVQQLILHQHIPTWFGEEPGMDVADILRDIVIHYPEKLVMVLKQGNPEESQMAWLFATLNVSLFIRSVSVMEKYRQPALAAFEKLYVAAENISLPGVASREIREGLFKKLLGAVITHNWKLIAAEELWHQLFQQLTLTKKILKPVFIQEMMKHRALLPPVFQLSLEKMQDDLQVKQGPPNSKAVPATMQKIMKTKEKQKGKTGTPVRNAGIVLLNSYMAMLFERLGLVQDRKFKEEAAQQQAVHYLQFLATGLLQSDETDLALNKVLCGLPLAHPVYDSTGISEGDKQLMEGLIRAAIDYWRAIGDCSIEGFRGNWLVRDGLLVEHEDKWELVVEKRAYDILINHSPFSFSIIKHTWMEKPLHVSWPY